MTYCLAMKLDTGLVFCSDSRTNAGPDRVSTYSKLHKFSLGDDRKVFLLGAGNLATTQAVVSLIERHIQDDAEFHLGKARYITEIADYVGQLSVGIQQKYAHGGPSAGFNAEATFILGGQIAGGDAELYMVYPEGNHISPSERYPFLQIGETKYGKPILDRIIRSDTAYRTAMRCALVSMDSTMRSNATVGAPVEMLYFEKDAFTQEEMYHVFEENDDYLVELRKSWDENVVQAFISLPSLNQIFSSDS